LYKIPANTLFTGKNLVFVPECPSTNTLALELSQQSPVIEGTVVITDEQTAGKGQRGNTWEAEPFKNLTFSLILKPGFLAVNKQFYLNVMICLALRDYLKERTPATVYIKWPNDVLVHEKKISGILIENQLQGTLISNSIAGIGFNINQKQFRSSAATSLSLVTGNDFNPGEELSAILGFIERRYLQLREGGYRHLMDEYLEALYRRHKKAMFSSNDEIFEGEIEDLDEWGKLRIKTPDGIRTFGAKEVRFEL
jgi:BirA family biotin operon repressor/biotin-[acetyl-CoA-carboxylase] ligase